MFVSGVRRLRGEIRSWVEFLLRKSTVCTLPEQRNVSSGATPEYGNSNSKQPQGTEQRKFRSQSDNDFTVLDY